MYSWQVIEIHAIEDVLTIPNLDEKWRVQAERLASSISTFESRGLINDRYYEKLEKAAKLMTELSRASGGTIIY